VTGHDPGGSDRLLIKPARGAPGRCRLLGMSQNGSGARCGLPLWRAAAVRAVLHSAADPARPAGWRHRPPTGAWVAQQARNLLATSTTVRTPGVARPRHARPGLQRPTARLRSIRRARSTLRPSAGRPRWQPSARHPGILAARCRGRVRVRGRRQHRWDRRPSRKPRDRAGTRSRAASRPRLTAVPGWS